MLESIEVRSFTAFSQARLDFARGLNVIVGENGTGKTHLLKLPYAVMAMSAEEGRRRGSRPPTKSFLQSRLAGKMIDVFRPEHVGHLVHRRQGGGRCEVDLRFSEGGSSVQFSFARKNQFEVVVDRSPSAWRDRTPVYLPTRELLTIYPGFVSLYETHHVEFDGTWRDTCILLGAPMVKGPRERTVARLLEPLEEQLGGRVVFGDNGHFYLRPTGGSLMEMPLVAEGWRKLAMLVRLLATGSLLAKGGLFWDEPESNLNPKLIRVVAKAILHVCQAGGQVVVATHSLFLLRELEVLLKREFENVEHRFFALRRRDEGTEVSQDDTLDGVDPLTLLDEDLEQSDRFIEEFMS